MRVKLFARAFFGACFILSVVALLCSVGMVLAQPAGTNSSRQPIVVNANGETEHVVISENITFSWPVVVVIVVSASGYAGMVYSVNQHHKDGKIHLDFPTITSKLPTREECALKHTALENDVAEIKEGMKEIRRLLKEEADARHAEQPKS